MNKIIIALALLSSGAAIAQVTDLETMHGICIAKRNLQANKPRWPEGFEKCQQVIEMWDKSERARQEAEAKALLDKLTK